MSRGPSLLFVNQHYWPDVAATGQMLTDLAEHLAAEGFDVHVLTGSAHYAGGDVAAPQTETRAGVTIHRVQTTAFGRGSHAGRLLDYLSFYVVVLARTVAGRRFDRVILLTTPPLLGTVGALARTLRGVRYGIWSMDLHPDAEEALGMLRAGRPLARALHVLNTWGYRRADFIVDLGRHMQARIAAKGVPAERLHTIPVWNSADEVQPAAQGASPMRAELGLAADTFVVMYSGNAGLAHCFDEVVAAMTHLRDRPDIAFVFVGGGPRRREIEAAAAADPGLRVHQLGYVPREQLDDALALGDAHLLTLRTDMAGIAVPSKLFGIMAAGRPVLMVGPLASEPAEAIRTHDLGVVVEPGPDGGAALADAIVRLASDPDEVAAMGRRARAVFLETYERDGCCAAWARLLAAETAKAPVASLPLAPESS